jgi:hypothetical protein
MLPYDAEAYRALFASYQAQHAVLLLALVCGLLLAVPLGLGRHTVGHRLAAVLTGAAWLWIGWGFHWQHFAGLNFAAPVYAVAFAVEGVLLLAWATGSGLPLQRQPDWRTRFGLFLLAAAWIGYPLFDLAEGAGPAVARLPGTAAAPTALFTLALSLLAARRRPWLILPLPLLACLVAVYSGWVLGMGADMWLAPLGLLTPFLLWTGARAGAESRRDKAKGGQDRSGGSPRGR